MSAGHSSDEPSSPAEIYLQSRSDFRGGFGWVALGVAVLIGSITMDRLKQQDINPYTIPGLLPGLLGIALVILGLLLIARSWPRMNLHAAAGAEIAPVTGPFFVRNRQLILVLALCAIFDLVLVGHGLPFWLASAIFVSVSILTFEQPRRQAAGRGLSLKDIAFALAVGLGAGFGITLVFQDIFLVRLP